MVDSTARVLLYLSFLDLHTQEITFGPIITVKCGDGMWPFGFGTLVSGYATDHDGWLTAAVPKLFSFGTHLHSLEMYQELLYI